MNRFHTDGACRGNPGPGGWAWANGPEEFASGAEGHTTNQRMEIRAVIEALQEHPEGPIEIVSDSTYVVKCFHDSWYVGWLRRNWKNSKGERVANQDLWEQLLPLALESGRDVTFSWVKGHSGDRMNDFVDELATQAADAQRGRHS
ncbi:MAG TPA: ribonuclease H [Acidimicrobiales bacterium]|nr:ribonuclease H [Acidimicrobiales bacterium]